MVLIKLALVFRRPCSSRHPKILTLVGSFICQTLPASGDFWSEAWRALWARRVLKAELRMPAIKRQSLCCQMGNRHKQSYRVASSSEAICVSRGRRSSTLLHCRTS
jgi:hypothetical protein